MVTGQERNRVAMSYLQHQTLTLVLNRFKTSAEGWRPSESDNDAVQSLWQRAGNYLSVLRMNQKRMEATWGPSIFPLDWSLRLLYAHWALNTFFYPFHRAIIALPLRFMGFFALILRPHCAATETVALPIMSKVLFRRFQ